MLLALAAPAHAFLLDATGRPSPAAREAISWLLEARQDGLDPADYGVERWARLLGQPAAPSDAAAHDDALAAALERYLHDLSGGRVTPRALGLHYESTSTDAPDLRAILKAAVTLGSPALALRAATPRWPQYGMLRDALQRYRTLAGQPGWRQGLPPPPGGKLEAGASWDGLPELATRLSALGDLPASSNRASTLYDTVLQQAVRAFQSRHGLEPDGIVGKATLTALDVPPATRAQQIELALEQSRLTPLPAAARFIVVNVPEFMLYAFEGGKQSPHQVFRMRVIVGKARTTPTPLFSADLNRIEFSPYWNIPRSIARAETLPKLRSNPAYLSAQGMEFVGPEGQISTSVTPGMLDTVVAGGWRIRQRPGPNNSLGDVKFVLPNRFGVFLHHTPSTGLFQRARRDFSHGCVRVEDPLRLAAWLLAGDPAWTEARIRAAIAQPHPETTPLPQTVPVLITYQTVVVHEGRVHFLPDLYRRDDLLSRALAARTTERTQPSTSHDTTQSPGCE